MTIAASDNFKAALRSQVDRSGLQVLAYNLLGDSTWVDLTSYVQDDGIGGAQEELSQLSGTASANTLNLTFINDDGRFSPLNTKGPYYGRLTPNVQFQVNSTVPGETPVRVFTGWSADWRPDAAQRICTLQVEDVCRLLRRKDVAIQETFFNATLPTVGYYLTTAIERAAWLAGLRWDTVNTATDLNGVPFALASQLNADNSSTPVTVNKTYGTVQATYYNAGVLVMKLDIVPLAMQAVQMAGNCLTLMDQLAKVVDGRVYADAQGVLNFRARMYVNDSTRAVAETFTVSNIQGLLHQQTFEDTKYTKLINKATVTSTPLQFKLNPDSTIKEEPVDFKGDLFEQYWLAPGENYPASPTTNFALGKIAVTTSGTVNAGSLTKVTDGVTTSGGADFVGISQTGAQWVQVDLGDAYTLDKVTVWHYWADGRTYHGTKTEVGVEDGAGGITWTTIFDSAISGEYPETSGGHVLNFDPRPVRYIRDWVNGSTANTSNHWVEIQGFRTSEGDIWCQIPSGIQLFKTSTYPSASNFEIVSTLVDDKTQERRYDIQLQAGFPVFEHGRIKLAFTNTGALKQLIKRVTFKGKLMRPVQQCKSVQLNSQSIALYDTRDNGTYTNNFIPNSMACEQLAAWQVLDGSTPKHYITLSVMYGVPWLEINDRITVSETVNNTITQAMDFIVKRITWRWGSSGYQYTIEAVSLSTDFTPKNLPYGASLTKVEASTTNQNGTQSGQQPPQAIDGSQTLVGLNNIPAFAAGVNYVKTFSSGFTAPGGAMNNSMGMAFDGADVFVADWQTTTSAVYKVNSLTGAVIAVKTLQGANADPRTLAVGGPPGSVPLLWATDIWNYTIQVIDPVNYASNTWAIKATLTGKEPRDLICAGGKLYVVARDASGFVYLLVWNSLTTTLQNAPDATYTLWNTSSTYPGQMTYDGTYLYIPLYEANRIVRFKVSDGTFDNAFISLGANERCQGLVHDGCNLWACILNTVTTKTNLLRFYLTPGGVVRDPKQLTLGSSYGFVLYDGMSIWVACANYLYQVATSNNLVATYNTYAFGPGMMTFDGQAVWVAGLDGAIRRVPARMNGRQFT